MLTISEFMIRSNHKAIIAMIDVDGTTGNIWMRTNKGFNGDVTVSLKMRNEKTIKLFTLPDNRRLFDVRDLLREYIETKHVSHWMPALELEPHVENIEQA